MSGTLWPTTSLKLRCLSTGIYRTQTCWGVLSKARHKTVTSHSTQWSWVAAEVERCGCCWLTQSRCAASHRGDGPAGNWGELLNTAFVEQHDLQGIQQSEHASINRVNKRRWWSGSVPMRTRTAHLMWPVVSSHLNIWHWKYVYI